MHSPTRCSKCGSLECNPFKCRFCNCPSWWNCEERGCYEQAKDRYAEATIKRDKGTPRWLQEARTGARDQDVRRR